MNKMNMEYTADHYFAALKLIEQLYKNGEIPAYPFGGAVIGRFCGPPSPHLTPSILPVLSEKKI